MYYQLFPAISTISKNSDGFEKISNISIHFSMLAIFIEHLSIELSMFKSQFYLYVYITIYIYLLLLNEQQQSSLSFESKETKKKTKRRKKNIFAPKDYAAMPQTTDEFTVDGAAKVKEAGCWVIEPRCTKIGAC